MLDVAHPYRGFFEAVTVAVNTALETGLYRTVDMIGFSTGAWVTSVYAALDPRIRRSYPVAGTLPMYLRGPRELTQPRLHESFVQKMSYLDMYVLASAGRNRGQLQIFNRYDRCCFANTVARLYVDDVRSTVQRLATGGQFDVYIYETHARHKISQRALNEILADMARIPAQ